ncbi:hypothetical protein ACFV1L_21350 [Kitasatospora sp. NPDC059646]|uniref:hypothetical protein n=1 Tax=Kitasatospora sp. NPDC059646 TaxID=3346893 RepID=UPI0036BB1AB1
MTARRRLGPGFLALQDSTVPEPDGHPRRLPAERIADPLPDTPATAPAPPFAPTSRRRLGHGTAAPAPSTDT